ncbi:hypothetical protein ACQP0C_13295 [Nocardia sp. CA-129566]|uniref:hypothetical protein n=1 Tax=Nocardia sp. CA-129566 TaxID=3239976 RepID=UPI003D964A89
MATVGISAERTMVRGVVLGDGAPEIVLCAAQPRLREDEVGAAIIGVLDGFAEELGDSARVEDVAIVYRSVAERRLIVSQLAAGQWASSSLVSERSALAVMTREEPGLDEFDTVLALEIADGHTSFVLLGPERDAVSASGSWAYGTVDADTADQTVGRILPILDSVAVRPDAVAVCGSGADDPDIATVLVLGLEAPVIPVADPADAVARGAALIAAQRLRELPVAVPTDDGRTRRLLLGAAAVATVLGASGIAVAQIRDDHPVEVASRTAESLPPSMSAAPAPITIEAAPSAESSEPVTIEPTSGPIWSTTTTPTPIRRTPPRTASAPTTETTDPPEPTASTTAESPTSTTVGAPDGSWLFPGESPPPPFDADPAVIRAWWDNHWMLQQRWLGGR